jgi:transcriptional regulator with XRE-family HTH domain
MFCAYLREQRESTGLSLDDIARITKIPPRSLDRLEAGQFEDLPGDVFVRGFLRSYARCLRINPDDTVKRYARCGLSPAPVSVLAEGSGATRSSSAAREIQAADKRAASAEQAKRQLEELSERASDGPAAAQMSATQRLKTFLPSSLFPEQDTQRRGPITLAVIILVIVATLTMSYLLRRPSDSGDGITRLDRANSAEVYAAEVYAAESTGQRALLS